MLSNICTYLDMNKSYSSISIITLFQTPQCSSYEHPQQKPFHLLVIFTWINTCLPQDKKSYLPFNNNGREGGGIFLFIFEASALSCKFPVYNRMRISYSPPMYWRNSCIPLEKKQSRFVLSRAEVKLLISSWGKTIRNSKFFFIRKMLCRSRRGESVFRYYSF